MTVNRFLSVTVACLCLTAGSAYSYAQDYHATPVTVSTEKVKMAGKQYYSHVVLEKQTIYSISKAYNVSVDDIYAANPGLKESGLKKNAVILIPDRSYNDNTDESKDKKVRENRKKNANDEDKFIIHTVRWYEDLDVISEKYGIPVNVIMEINGLKGRKLKNRQKLRIPQDPAPFIQENADEAGAEEQDSAPEETADRDTEPENTAEQPSADINYLFPKKTVSISMLLPLNAQDSTAGSRSNMDFYSGALLAAKDLGDEGINVDMSVFDVAGGQLHITEDRLRKSDVVIGPVSYGDLSRLMTVAPQNTYVVSPLDHRAEALAGSYRNFIQAPSSYSVQYEDLIDWIDEERVPGDTLLVIYEKGLDGKEDFDMISAEIERSGMGYASFSYSILEGRDILNSLKSKMPVTGRTHLLVASESEAFVNDVVRNVNLLIHDKYNVSLYASSKIRGFETIEVENLHNANLHVSTSYYIDYDRKDVQDFIMKYRALFNTEPTPFSFQGYDITRYFIETCAKYGNAWTSVLPLEEEEMLQSGFKFSRIKVGNSEVGYENYAVRRIEYGPDYSVTLSKGL